MKSETKICQNCKKDFTIESEDFKFYEKIKVPPPTFCPECRRQRRLSWRNEKTLYKRTCDLCKNKFISMYHANVVFPVYCRECWYSDKWDIIKYSKEYDFSKSFFQQFKELATVVPRVGIWQRNVINCPYSNMCAESRNVYLSISVILGSENIFYSRTVDKSFNIFDSFNIRECENCYENIEGEKNYNSQHLLLSKNCIDSYFLVDCVNCSNCILSHNLRNKKFCIKNKQYSEEDYQKELEKLNLGNRKFREIAIKEFSDICKRAIYRYTNTFKSLNSIGNNLLNVKNCIECFDVYDSENCKYSYRTISIKDCMDTDLALSSELMYEYNTGAKNDSNLKFSFSAIEQVRDSEYTDSCMSCSNIFGCISLRNKDYAILNKTYSKEEYEGLVEKIKKHMNDVPYVDKKERIYKYGEYFPIELSRFAYNETAAQDYFPLTKEQIIEEGYGWFEPEIKHYEITIKGADIPEDIKEVDKKIISEILGCIHEEKCKHQCLKVFRITQDELQFYKKYNIPIPDICSNCRHYDKFAKLLPLKLWGRKCMREGCQNEFETPYAPDRPEIVYCEKCYQAEVY